MGLFYYKFMSFFTLNVYCDSASAQYLSGNDCVTVCVHRHLWLSDNRSETPTCLMSHSSCGSVGEADANQTYTLSLHTQIHTFCLFFNGFHCVLLPRMHCCCCSVMSVSERLGQARCCLYHINIIKTYCLMSLTSDFVEENNLHTVKHNCKNTPWSKQSVKIFALTFLKLDFTVFDKTRTEDQNVANLKGNQILRQQTR